MSIENKTVIKIENLEFSYDQRTALLKIPVLNIKSGEKVFIYGPSGHGKSTLLNILTGVLPHQKGELEVLGVDYTKAKAGHKNKLRAKEIGYIFQNFNLIPYLNVEENILLPATLYGRSDSRLRPQQECEELMQLLNMTEHRNKRPSQLSLGQQQRVAQARALLGGPKLLIADEPTSSLDEQNTKDFMQLLVKSCDAKNITLIFVSHDQRLKQYFDHHIDLSQINKATTLRENSL